MCVHARVDACNQDEFPSARAREDAAQFWQLPMFDHCLIGSKIIIRPFMSILDKIEY